MKKLLIIILALSTVFIVSCDEEDEKENGNDEIKSFVVAEDYSSIQSAIDASVDGDTIIVQPGTYKENITFKGRKVIVRSTAPHDPGAVAVTIIDGSKAGRVVTFFDSETNETVLWGFTIKGGEAGSDSRESKINSIG